MTSFPIQLSIPDTNKPKKVKKVSLKDSHLILKRPTNI